MNLIPKANITLVLAACGLFLAPDSAAQTNVWLEEDTTPTYDLVRAMASDSAGCVFQASSFAPDPFSLVDARVTRRTAGSELS
jgi:hypothetical protein